MLPQKKLSMGVSHLFRRKSVPQILKDAEEGVIGQEHSIKLSRALKVRDLTMFGIAAIIGAGIFGTIGQASFDGGPAVSLLFIFIAIACGFAALCYAEFASMIPISGSAYTYSYAAFGELVAWIIGWDLLMEYAIGNIAVAQSWSAYFQTFIAGFGLKLPAFLTIDFLSAYNSGEAKDASTMAYQAWSTAPHLGPIPIIVDLPALFLIVFITSLIYIGIKESRAATNTMVMLKIIVVIIVIMVGMFYVNPDNWTPFMPNGVAGVMKGVAAVFFAYIGFDAISTTAEECENPQRDLPKGMINSLIICTILYVAISFVLTGMTSYTNLAVRDPLAAVFTLIPSLHWLSGVIALSAIIATASVFLVFQLGQPRIWMSMSRDGLLPKKFSKIHPKYRTPGFATIITGVFTAVPILFLNFSVVINLTSIGTLFAFALVCAGVVVIHHRRNVHYARVKLQEDKNPEVTDQNDFPEGKFKVPYINAKIIMPVLFVIGWAAMLIFSKETMMNFLLFKDPTAPGSGSMTVALQNLPFWIFVAYSVIITICAYRMNLSLIPMLGLSMCVYLMSALTVDNWLRFGIWLAIGLVIYFVYGYNHSKLNRDWTSA